MAMPSPAKRPRIQSGDDQPDAGLAVMLTDVEEASDGTILLWGLAAADAGASTKHRTVLLRCPDYQPYFFIPCPQVVCPDSQELQEPQQQDLQRLRRLINARLPPDQSLQALSVLALSPIMFFRPHAPQGRPYIKASLKTGVSAKRTAAAVEKIAAGGLPGFSWRQRGTEPYEADIKLVMRFLSDTSLSGGSWLWASPQPSTHNTHLQQQQQQQQQEQQQEQQQGGSSTPQPLSSAVLTAAASQEVGSADAAAAAAGGGSSGGPLFEEVPPGSSSRRSGCDVELVLSWRCLHSLTPDATQLAQQDWRPQVLSQLQPLPPQLSAAAASAAAGDILPLQLVVLDVLLAPSDGSDRSTNPQTDPIVTIACHITTTGSSSSNSSSSSSKQRGMQPAQETPDASPEEAEEDGGSSGGSSGGNCHGSSKVVFLLAGAGAAAALPPEVCVEGLRLVVCGSERQLLTAWRDWLLEVDPDGLVVFQVRDNLGALAARFAALQIDGGSVLLSRATGRFGRSLTTKSVVQYSVAWVKSQSRMASTSNQETFKAEGLSGRLVIDVLRQVLTGQSLATFSLVDCCQSLLDLTLEVMPAHIIAALQQQLAAAPAAQPPPSHTGQQHSSSSSSSSSIALPPSQVAAVRAGLRLARYSLSRCAAVASLMSRLASVPEGFEMARATGLTLDQVAYNAQMIRTLSLLLRAAHRSGFILGGRQDAVQLVESPFLLHPIEAGTAGLYTTPVATCDFASLYPSLYRAYNLCYTTLVHPDDVPSIKPDSLTVTPTGAAFLKPSLRPGILPAILSALMSARASTRAALKAAQQQQKALAQQQQQQEGGGGGGGAAAAVELSHQLSARAAVLDGRQKALKLTANALYGFTGAQASPLQCAPIADSCLALGAATCRGAAASINKALQEGLLGPQAAGGKVIYAQTDSVFVHFPSATPAEAVALGQAAARLVTDQLPHPIELKYERVMAPFLLLHVNRYAGRSFESAAAAEACEGQLLVKGVRAVWRQSAPFIQNTLMGALQRILLSGDVPGAVSFVEGEVARLLSGHVGVWELAMTGGLWRVTGQQLERAAAADEEGEGPRPAAAAGAAAGGDVDDVKGPHTNLAVRLSKRDPNKKWLLGERLSYVLLTGSKSQDDAAEDPLTAVKEGLTPNYQLYWQNKLQTPLKEIFSTCINPEQLRQLLHGPHTQFRATGATTGEALEPLTLTPTHTTTSLDSTSSAAAAAAAAGGGSGSRQAPGTTSSRGQRPGRHGATAAAGPPVTPSPGRHGATAAAGPPVIPSPGRHGATAAAGPPVTPSPGKKTAGATASRRQQGSMKRFFTATARCLGCKAVLSSNTAGSSSAAPPGVDPGLCPECRQEEGKLAAVYLNTVYEAGSAAASLGGAHSACRRCHSGGQLGAVVCENGECPILYVRYQAERAMRNADHKLLRLEW